MTWFLVLRYSSSRKVISPSPSMVSHYSAFVTNSLLTLTAEFMGTKAMNNSKIVENFYIITLTALLGGDPTV